MLKSGGLLAATAVLAVLGGLVWWSNKNPPVEKKAPDSPRLLALGVDQIEGIRIAKPGSDPVVLKKVSSQWEITEPKPFPADQDAVRAMAGSLATLNADRLIEEHPASLADFGLVSPPEEIDVTVKGAVNKLLLGSDTPAGTATYAKLASNPAVYTISSATKSAFDKSVNDLRDKRLLVFDQDKLKSVSVASKGALFEFGKNVNSDWQITKPKVMRADPTKVEDLLRKLREAKMDLSSEDKPPATTRVATVSVTDNNGPKSLEVSQAADKTFYAAGHKLTGDLGEAVKDKSVEDFRNKKLFDFGFNDPGKVEVDGAALPKTGIQGVIDKLRDLSATSFAESMKGTQAMTLAVTSGKREAVTINKNGDGYLAQREGDPAVYVLAASAFDDLKKAIAETSKKK